jgi:hypothetical protein
MIGPGAAFAQARLQAAFAALPSEADWLQLRGARTLSAYLEEARHGPLRPWVRGFSAQSDAHAIERGLRALYVEEVDRVTEQAPERWRPAVVCWRWLPFLPLLGYAGPEAPMPEAQMRDWMPDWMRADARLARLLGGDGQLADDARAPQPPAGALADDADGAALVAAWRDQWQQALAALGKQAQAGVEQLGARLRQHQQCFEGLESEPAWRLRVELREELRLDFHRQSAVPKVVFLYLVLLALDLERLRRALLDRALFGGWVEAVESAPSARQHGHREAA